MKKKKSELLSFGLGLGVAGAGLGLGAGIVQKSGGNAAAVGTFSTYLPTLGKVKGGNILINELSKVGRVPKRKKR